MGVLTIVIVGFDDIEQSNETKIATRWKCQSVTSSLEGEMPQIKRSMNKVPSNMSEAMLGTMPEQIHAYKSSIQTLKSITRSMGKGCCVAVRSLSMDPW